MNHCDADESNGRDGQLIGSVEELAARLSRVEARIDELDDGELLIGLASGASSKSEIASAALESEEKVEPAYPDMRAWVSEYFAPMYARPLGGEFRWCRRWWDHAEAISRLEALWRSWETLRSDPGLGMATWYRDYLDPQFTVLLSNRGPFAPLLA
ncbi:MAG: DUF4913 domain-containing protein [Actinomycetota bacterium]|nr:DUF4913 domain-containing protein [Actinomycetota bacterium]